MVGLSIVCFNSLSADNPVGKPRPIQYTFNKVNKVARDKIFALGICNNNQIYKMIISHLLLWCFSHKYDCKLIW